jgi:hypothetical protein
MKIRHECIIVGAQARIKGKKLSLIVGGQLLRSNIMTIEPTDYSLAVTIPQEICLALSPSISAP